ncbi:MAG: hypothetical protein JNK48_07970 [Bryobacterales bacterium]|nr:hypothetical protein [Bryobacterales bacterium]
MAVLRKPVSGLFRHPIDGAHAAQVLREKGFTKVEIQPVAESAPRKPRERSRRLMATVGAAMTIGAAVVAGFVAGQVVSRAAGVFAALSLAFLGMMAVVLFLQWPRERVQRYPRRDGVLLTVQCRGEEEPEVADALRHAGAIKVTQER